MNESTCHVQARPVKMNNIFNNQLHCITFSKLGKWILHNRRIGNYVGIDVARGSLGDAALRARKMRQLNKCVFTCADLGADVPGRLKSSKHTKMQKLLSWSLKDDDGYGDPKFELLRGGGISESDRFDVVRYVVHHVYIFMESV